MVKAIGSQYLGNNACAFTVWSPFSESMDLVVASGNEQKFPLKKDAAGYWSGTFNAIAPGALYHYQINNGLKRPDPASHAQPQGVHGPSQVIDHTAFKWSDDQWYCIPPSEMIMYELHTGTFTPEGTFNGILSRIQYLNQLGVNAIELMPVAQFPGSRNWGYDGVYPFAVHSTYGHCDDLKQLVNDCHRAGIAVILDVVYNHIGPEGNYLHDYGPYFTEKYSTPWGSALNFDDAYCDAVRNYFISNALMWFHHYHIDALRLDAVHAIKDTGAKHFLQELAEATEDLSAKDGRKYFLIAESDLNDARIISEKATGGYGINCQWSDDLHHAIHALATGEQSGYYEDFGTAGDVEKAFNESFVYDWKYSPHRKKTFGSKVTHLPPNKFIVFSQNHDQVGNRMMGDRLSANVSFEMLKLIAGSILISPYIPLLFMGEEYGEQSPFLYFISHSDAELVEAVRQGRKKEFAAFNWQGAIPDPQSEATFEQCKLKWKIDGDKSALFHFYQFLIGLRKQKRALKSSCARSQSRTHRYQDKNIFIVIREGDHALVCFLNFHHSDHACLVNPQQQRFRKILDSSDKKWNGPGALSPEHILEQQEIMLRQESIVIYETE